MKSFFLFFLPAILFMAVSAACFLWKSPTEYLSIFVDNHILISYAVFVWLLVLATVLMPVTAMPAIPVAAQLFGPFVTGVLSVFGWTLGAVGAFLIARYVGRPVIQRFISLKAVDDYAARVPETTQFFSIILVRLILPVDIMSYVIGFTSTVGLVRYAVATAIGISWFAFAFAYLGNAMFHKDKLTLGIIGVMSLAIFITGWYILLRQRKPKD